MPNVVKIQSGYKVQPLSKYLFQPVPPAAPTVDFPKINAQMVKTVYRGGPVFKNLRDFRGRKSFQCPDFLVELHLGGARMSSDNLPSIVKFLEIHRRIAHYLLLGIGESDRPPGEG
jgi:hypothetical protein